MRIERRRCGPIIDRGSAGLVSGIPDFESDVGPHLLWGAAKTSRRRSRRAADWPRKSMDWDGGMGAWGRAAHPKQRSAQLNSSQAGISVWALINCADFR